jgi:putative ABC transport system substrate-binding protein
VQGFQDGMTALGYIEGEKVTYLFAGEPVSGADLDAALDELVAAEVDLIFTAGTPTGVAAHRITGGTGIPVVFGVIADPIAAGVMTDLALPGGNMTGVKLSASQDRRLELFLRIAPNIERVFVPFNPDDSAPASAVAQIVNLAPALGIELVLGEARSDEEVVDLLVELPEDIDAIFLVPDSTVNARLTDIVALASARKLPLSGPSTAQVEEGALTTYGFIHEAAGAQAARIADRILRGANPGEMPVETTEYYLAINLATAKTIGLEIPDEILQEAEIIIRAEEPE